MKSERLVGRCDQTMVSEADFSRELRRAFDDVWSHAVVSGFGHSGSCSLFLGFSSEQLGKVFLASFPQIRFAHTDLAIAFVTAKDIDLGHLVPKPADQSNLLITNDHYLAWIAGDLPVLYALDRHAGRGFVWLAASKAPNWELSRPALPIIHAFTVQTPWTGAHGGAVGRGGRFLLLAGKGKAGKTTAALACARAGWQYAGDDYVFTNSETGRVEPLYCSARLRIDMVDTFADLLHDSAAVSEDDGEVRHELRLARSFGNRVEGGALAAILLPRRNGAKRPCFEPARRVDAYAALATVTIFGLPGWPKATTEKLSALVGLAPVYFVDTGSVPTAIPEAFGRFLDRL